MGICKFSWAEYPLKVVVKKTWQPNTNVGRVAMGSSVGGAQMSVSLSTSHKRPTCTSLSISGYTRTMAVFSDEYAE